jgi:hypothetical protein
VSDSAGQLHMDALHSYCVCVSNHLSAGFLLFLIFVIDSTIYRIGCVTRLVVMFIKNEVDGNITRLG